MTTSITTTNDKTSAGQIAKVRELAGQGCTVSEVCAALFFTEAERAETLENDEHPLYKAYWTGNNEYTKRLRDLALNIAENSTDETVRAKMTELLLKENRDAIMDKKVMNGYLNIRKLLSVVREQFAPKKEKVNPKARIEGKAIGRNGTKRTGGQSPQSSRAKAIVKEVKGGEEGGGKKGKK